GSATHPSDSRGTTRFPALGTRPASPARGQCATQSVYRPAFRRTVGGMPTPAPTRRGWAAPRGPFRNPPAPPRPDVLAAVHRRRDPTATPLDPLVQHHLETFLIIGHWPAGGRAGSA